MELASLCYQIFREDDEVGVGEKESPAKELHPQVPVLLMRQMKS